MGGGRNPGRRFLYTVRNFAYSSTLTEVPVSDIGGVEATLVASMKKGHPEVANTDHHGVVVPLQILSP